MIALSFIGFLAMFLLIGLWSVRESKGTREDYYVAGRSIKPWLTGLSAVATNNSGYMFIGVIGYTYVTGLASIWLMLGWIAGDFIASLMIHKRLRIAVERSNETSFAGAISHWNNQRMPHWQRLMGLISIIFLLTYAAAQLVAGSKALHVLLGWPAWSGMVTGAVMVGFYCMAGGIRASVWTDAAQSVVMIVAMGLLLASGIISLGGAGHAWVRMGEIPGFLNWFPDDLAFPGLAGGLLFALAWLFAGFSVAGQPHIMIRFMMLDDPKKFTQMRIWYYLWFFLFYAAATGVGMVSRVYLANAGGFDAEVALPLMASQLFSPFLIGLVLAGIFAATMSTADSLILSCSSAITHDVLPHRLEKTYLIKFATLSITCVALLLALTGPSSVFSLVVFSWSALASAFAPLICVMAYGGQPSEKLAIVMTFIGLSVAIGWRLLGWHTFVYEGMPGILAGLLVFAVAQVGKRNHFRRLA